MVHEVIWYFSVAFLGLISIVYACKVIYFPGAVRRELIHPIRSNFCRMPAVSLMALVASAPKSVTDQTCEPGKSVPVSMAYIIFAMMILLNLHTFRSWKLFPSRGMSLLKDMNPSCNIPVIANYLAALVLGMADLYGPAFLLFTFGTMMWFVFYIAFFISMYMAQGAHNIFYVLPQPPHNVYFLMHVAPSVASMAWTAFAGNSLPEVSQAFYFVGIIIFAITATHNLILLLREPPHVLIPWSMVFPVTAIPTSTRNYYNMRPFYELDVITHVLQFFQVFVFATALFWTVVLATKGKIFVRDELMVDVFPQQPVRSISSRGLHAEGFGAEDGDGWSGSGEAATPHSEASGNWRSDGEYDKGYEDLSESRIVAPNVGVTAV
jgi:tellurite resistance protein